MSSTSIVCSLCQAVIDSEDELQQHYLTSCPGYDADQPRSKLAAAQQRASSQSPTDHTPAPPKPKQYFSVKFLWQPLTEITYPKVTLLAAFENGSVDLLLDSEGGHYESSYINVEKGKFEGQLVIGDSFVNPVKDFTIEKNDVIVLQLELTPCTCPTCKSTQRTDSQTTHTGGKYKVLLFLPPEGEESESYDRYQQSAPTYDSTSGTRNIRALDSSHPRPLGNNRSYDSGTTSRSTIPPSTDINNAPQRLLSNYQSTSYQRPAPLPQSNPRLEPTNQTTVGNRAGRSVDSPYLSNLDVSSVAPPHPSTSNRGGGSESSNVDRTQRRPDTRSGSEVTAGTTDLLDQLRLAREEKETQRLRYETKTAELEEQLLRLQAIIEIQAKRAGVGGGWEGGTEGGSQVRAPDNQLSVLTEEKRARVKAEQDLKESKDRIAALENQIEEYVSAMKDQNTAIQGAMVTNKTREVEVARLQHMSTHTVQYMKKQQAEYAEALNALRKKIDKLTEDSVRIQQLNTSLSTEVENCRSGMKRLLEELRLKEDTIIQLQERAASTSTSNPGASLELETMRQKYEVWREEASKISPLLEEVQELQEQNDQLKAALAELKAAPPSSIPGAPEPDAYGRKSSEEYDRLMERCMELQATRVQLESELGPLREERATTLQELSQLREMVKHPERYEKLKEENAGLKEECGQLQEALQVERGNIQRQKELNKQLTQKLSDSTNPEQLQLVKERLERYRQERDTSRQQVEELQKQLGQLTVAAATAGQQQRQAEVQTFSAEKLHVESEDDRRSEIESEVRSKRQGDDTTPSLSCTDSGSMDSRTSIPSPTDDACPTDPSPPSSDVADSQESTTGGAGGQTVAQLASRRQTSNRGGADATATKPSPARSLSSTEQLPFSAQVNTKGGVKTLQLCKLTNPRKGMKVVAKRLGGEFDAGTIQYVGKVDGSAEDYVGIELDLPKSLNSSKGDGTSKTGKQYFKCTQGYGIYVPLAKVYMEHRTTLQTGPS